MFRDLKEYQEIAKIYADKVSKPEDLEERRGSSVEQLKKNRETVLPANAASVPPASAAFTPLLTVGDDNAASPIAPAIPPLFNATLPAGPIVFRS